METKTCKTCLKDFPISEFNHFTRVNALLNCNRCRDKHGRDMISALTIKPKYKARDKKYIELFDYEKARKESLNRLNQRPFYVK